MQAIKLDWCEIIQDSSLQDVLHKHKNVFRAGLGTLQGFKAKIIIEDKAIPKFCKARSIPGVMEVGGARGAQGAQSILILHLLNLSVLIP